MYREWAPDPAIAGRVICLWTVTATSSVTKLVVPDGSADLIWAPEGPQVAGPDTGPKAVEMAPGDRYLGIRFRPGAVGDALGVPIDALRDLRVPLTELGVPTELTKLADLPEPTAETMQQALAVRLRTTPGPDPAAPAIAAALRAGRSVGEVAWELGLSERQLHRRSLRAFGYGPKTLQRVIRLQRALRLARRGRALAEVAVASGYADQAHMANEVRRLTGVPMRRLVNRP
ncbi:helix-turn-helix domain-containing protein [Streptosporangium sp. NBC_01756]|uniref:helix-turn-helix domain-containing protein n=1 Tax=Streptosporangium sp. NBC_01756 TaxID=2975950 RepID=UPI002DDA61A7|nr:helix-turn-helix domain-containing protein [Streptosporangium sp. NBC_01756]WSC84277.1 helix-turn-helix domain-containing protein [Streptosporangium sp. NBC_01756]